MKQKDLDDLDSLLGEAAATVLKLHKLRNTFTPDAPTVADLVSGRLTPPKAPGCPSRLAGHRWLLSTPETDKCCACGAVRHFAPVERWSDDLIGEPAPERRP